MAEKENWSQHRHRIDTGQTGDKVDYPDPAAAPLGTDEEAGGARTPPEAIGADNERRKSEGNPVKADSSRTRQLVLSAAIIALVLVILLVLL